MGIAVKPPTSFWVIAIFALLWNITELYLSTFQLDLIQKNSSAEEFDALNKLPYWYGFVFLIALFSETIGVFMLLRKRKIAVPFFTASLIALLFVEFYWVFIIDINKTSILLLFLVPVIVIGIATFLYIYSKRAVKKGWIN